MAKRSTTIPYSFVSLNGANGAPLYRQLYDELRTAILSGQLRAGTRLPSTRELAADLRVSRNTVLNAFEQLLAEGYVEGQVGSGTYVSRSLPDELLHARTLDARTTRTPRAGRTLARRATSYTHARVNVSRDPQGTRPFRPGTPALDAFPCTLWARLLARRWRRPSADLLGYTEPAGYLPLREAVAGYLGAARAVRCEAAQVIVVAGSQQALDLVARLLIDEGDAVWLEEPGYLGARAAFKSAGARVVPVPVTAEGLNVQAGAESTPEARLVYITPSHQYPMGVTMTLGRRLALLEWANRAGAWVLEDDYDSEYRYVGRPLAALQGLDAEGRVIYLGTFSKVLFPALRLGYMVVPPDMVEVFTNARGLASRFSPTIEQAVLADFINEGHFARHIRRMRALYAERQAILLDAAARELRGLLELQPDAAGIHLVGRLPAGVDDVAASRAAAAHGLDVQPLSSFHLKRGGHGGLLLGYAGFNERQIRAGVRQLAVALRSVMRDKS
ncbi:MAG: PLP-dependent aminotransferase family protein [Acidobacteria bacterium]|nr:MAG: PLP-dependent aminotransferase family protein [Acidobacteriota bacterium]